jgi:[ribosomal protein S5]-alanine N-acetyltransferase
MYHAVHGIPWNDEGMPGMPAESVEFVNETIFETERLRIRPWTVSDSDLAAALEIYGDPEVLRYMGGGPGDADLVQARARIERYLKASEPRPGFLSGFGLWAIEVKATGAVIGSVELVPLDGGPEIEVGYHLARRYWGQGYATEAARGAVRYGFETIGLTRIVGVIYPENQASRNVLEKCGMVYQRRGTWFGWELDQFAVEAGETREAEGGPDQRRR